MLRFIYIGTNLSEAGRPLDDYRRRAGRRLLALALLTVTLSLPMASAWAEDAPSSGDAPAATVASAVWPDGFKATQAQAFVASASAGAEARKLAVTPPGAVAAVPPSRISPSRQEIALAASGAVFLFLVGWRTGVETCRKTLLWFDAKALGVRRIISVEDVKQDAVLTPAAVHERGWPLELMVKLLGPPDYAVVDPNGRIPPLILLCRARVEKLEQSEKYRRYYETRNHRNQVTAARVSKWIALHEELAPCTESMQGSV